MRRYNGREVNENDMPSMKNTMMRRILNELCGVKWMNKHHWVHKLRLQFFHNRVRFLRTRGGLVF